MDDWFRSAVVSSRLSSESGGYVCEFVDEVSQKYICTICQNVMKNACLAVCCGQHFCTGCLDQWSAQRAPKTCPHCRNAGFQSVPNKEKIREINELRVHCWQRAKGCGWSGELGTLQKHLDSTDGCEFVKVKCDNKGKVLHRYIVKTVSCSEEIERRHLAKHKKNECKYCPYTCQYCKCADTYEAIAGSGPSGNRPVNHFAVCEYYPLKCPNQCGTEGIQRRVLPTHTSECPLQKITCSFDDCNMSMMRKEMESHKALCDLRPYSCEYCGTNGTYLSITNKGRTWFMLEPSHYDSCQEYPLECENNCGMNNIKRKDMKTHRKCCPLEQLDCPLGEHISGRKILRKDMEKHEKEECEFRPFNCHYCSASGTYKSITGKGDQPLKGKCHYDVCKLYPLICPNQCGQNIQRCNMQQHHNECPLEPLDCPFKCVGKILRKDVRSHCEANIQKHMLLLAESNEKLASINRQLTSKVEELTSKVKDLTKEINEERARFRPLQQRAQRNRFF